MPEQEASDPLSKPSVKGADKVASASQTGSPRTGFSIWQPPTTQQLQNALPQYDIQQFLARGGMGAVYKARQKSLNRPVALKVLPPEFSDDDAAHAARFRHEAQTLAQLNHPAIVHVYDFGETTDGLRYFVMEFVDGTDVAAMIAGSGKLPADAAVKIITTVCDALAYAHAHGVIHRDIKPANVLIDNEGRVKVADFGISRMIDRTQQTVLTRTDMTVGTQEYAAPEMFTPGAMVDHRADIYAVGVMLYQMLTGEVPRVMFKLPSLRRPELGTRFDALICKALEPDPADRFESAAAMKEAVGAASRGDIAVKSSIRTGKNFRALPVIPTAGAIAALAVGAFLLKRNPATEVDSHSIAKAAAAEPHMIRLWNSPDKIKKSDGVSWEDDALRLDNAMEVMAPPYHVDALIRATIKMNPDAVSPSISLRGFQENGGDGRYSATILATEKKINLQVFDTRPSSTSNRTVLQEWPLPRAYASDEWAKLELRAVGDELMVSCDGQVLGTVHDNSLNMPGSAQVYATKAGFFRDIVYNHLDSPGSAGSKGEPIKSGAMKLWDGPDKIPDQAGARWEGNAVRLDHSALVYPGLRVHDAAVQAEVLMNPDRSSPQIAIRHREPRKGEVSCYAVSVHPKDGTIKLQSVVSGSWTVLKEWLLPRAYGPDEWLKLELRAVGDELSVSADDKLLGTIQDSSEPDGGSVMLWAEAKCYFRNIVFFPLDRSTTPSGNTKASDLQKPLPAIANWQDMTDEVRAKARGIPNLIVEPGLVRHGGTGNQAVIPVTRHGVRDYAIRLRFAGDGQITLRTRIDGSLYVLCQGNQTIFHHYEVASATPTLLRPNVPHPADFDSSAAHEMLVTMQGSTVSVWLDGRFVGDAQDTKYQDGDAKIVFGRSTVVHKVEVAELPAASSEAGFRSLFDGRSLDGWLALNGASPPDGWHVADGAITGRDHSAIMSREEFGDFELQMEWRVQPQGNGGIYYRVAESGMTERPMKAVEFNLMDTGIPAPPLKHSGAAFDVQAPSQQAEHPAGEWNTARLLVKGTRVEHWVNDKLVCRYDLADPALHNALDQAGIGLAFATLRKGRVALQDWTGEVFYRNVRIRELAGEYPH